MAAPDPFGTDRIRRTVLRAWADEPARFRADANIEQDYATAYRDRVIAELAQNAADAGRGDGWLRFELAGTRLTASNTGNPLDGPGVVSLANLRASAKREGETAGRFGVGFAAVVSVSDEPAIRSRDGGVRWSAEGARAEVAALPALAEEIGIGTRVPLLRLPFSDATPPVADFATEVVLALRDDDAVESIRAALQSVDTSLLLALPGLRRVDLVIDGVNRTLRRVGESGDLVQIEDEGELTRWRLVRRQGTVSADLLADRPAEEQRHPNWALVWATPVSPDGAPTGELPDGVAVVHAPTATDEPLDFPALLIASFPLEPTRRRVAPGPLTDFLAEQAGAAYADLVTAGPASPARLRLVPTGVPAGAVDARCRSAALPALSRAPLLAGATGAPLAPRDAVAVDDDLVAALADAEPNLLAAGWTAGAGAAALARLGVHRPTLADLVDRLAELDREPEWWRALYRALDRSLPASPSEREPLAGLPVPIAGGGTARGPRGLVLPGGSVSPETISALGLRPVHPDAVDPLLRGLGAVAAEPGALLDEPRVQAAVAHSFDAALDGADYRALGDAVLSLLAAEGRNPDRPWLAELALPGEDGEPYPAGELLLPGGALAGLVRPDAPFGRPAAELVQRHGAEVLRAAGALDGFAVVSDDDVPVDLPASHDLDGEDDWLAGCRDVAGDGTVVAELAAVRDLEYVRDDAWLAALGLLAAEPLRRLWRRPPVTRPGGSPRTRSWPGTGPGTTGSPARPRGCSGCSTTRPRARWMPSSPGRSGSSPNSTTSIRTACSPGCSPGGRTSRGPACGPSTPGSPRCHPRLCRSACSPSSTAGSRSARPPRRPSSRPPTSGRCAGRGRTSPAPPPGPPTWPPGSGPPCSPQPLPTSRTVSAGSYRSCWRRSFPGCRPPTWSTPSSPLAGWRSSTWSTAASCTCAPVPARSGWGGRRRSPPAAGGPGRR